VLIRLVTPDLAVLDAALDGAAALAAAVGADVAEGWEVFPGSLRRVRDAVAADPASARWGTRLFVLGEPRTLVGWGGFKGVPRAGAVELGYAIAPAWEGRGIATAAVRGLVREAFSAPGVRTVLAHTLAAPNGSVRVLEKTGFVRDGEHTDEGAGPVWRWRLDRADAQLGRCAIAHNIVSAPPPRGTRGA
jgi:ribosomal-protein-alanine N-acetyltransferase